MSGNEKFPLLSLSEVRLSPVWTRSSVIFAAGTTAPVGSVTVPRTSVDVVCAADGAPQRISTSRKKRAFRIELSLLPYKVFTADWVYCSPVLPDVKEEREQSS